MQRSVFFNDVPSRTINVQNSRTDVRPLSQNFPITPAINALHPVRHLPLVNPGINI